MIVDDAHGVGVLGETGRGTVEHVGLLGEVDVITISCVPERSDCVACRSPPSAPPQKAWIFILPPDFSVAHAAILATPLPTGCSWLTPLDRRMVRSVNCAWAGSASAAAAMPAARRLRRNFMLIS